MPKAGDALLLLCSWLCKVISVLVLPGKESNTRLTAAQIRLTEKTIIEVSEQKLFAYLFSFREKKKNLDP